MRVAIIGGTGVLDPGLLKDICEHVISTPYGDAAVKTGTYGEEEVAFIARHGWTHSIPPHKVNYRANISALKQIGVTRIIATSAVGSLNPDMKPGDCVVLDQFIDFTKARASTFFDGGDGGVVHTDFTEPYCKEIRACLIKAGQDLGIPTHVRGTYVATEGPRFETAAEIRMFRLLGGDVVGMTNVPECVLAREAGICYAAVAVVTNFAAGISSRPLSHQEVVEVMHENSERLRKIIARTIETLPARPGCDCPGIAQEATATPQEATAARSREA
ncbi:MAG TPA: S-methyl-5'-thioadenosine phosphorylase [Firmicutes bacterium]|nr:S-methyl-5'-thioadenosine phosphorylase [Bacillota bacterium]